MSENVRPPPFRWTVKTERAAELLAEDELTDAEIASLVGVTDRQMRRWKLHPEFDGRVKAQAARLAAAGGSRAIARRARRVRTLDERWQALQRIAAERAVSPEMQDVPGGRTGYLRRTVKGIGSGETFQVVEEFEVDTGFLKELREHEKQAAQELDQWAEKHVVQGPKGESPFPPWEDLAKLPREDLLRLYEDRRRLAEGKDRE